MIKRCAALATAALLSGCQTFPSQEEPKVPAAYASMFASCDGKDGALKLTWFEEETPLGSAEAEWRSEPEALTVGLVSPLGQVLVAAESKGEDLSVRGPMAQRLPPLSLDENGLILIDGHLVPVRPLELACFLAGSLPGSWLATLRAVEVEEDRTKIWMKDDHRLIRVIAFGNEGRARRYCARLTWGGFLGFFERELYFCHHPDTAYAGTLKILDYTLKWVPLDGQ